MAVTLAALLHLTLVDAGRQSAVFAGGCFWCVEQAFDAAPGVLSTTSGYAGGTGADPTYRTHASTGHIEAVLVEYDDSATCYADLLPYFWHNVDPLDPRG